MNNSTFQISTLFPIFLWEDASFVGLDVHDVRQSLRYPHVITCNGTAVHVPQSIEAISRFHRAKGKMAILVIDWGH